MAIKVSIIMSAYNAQNTIKQAINSVLSQSYDNLELIIVNDSSTDDTDSIVCKYDDERIKYIKHDINKGAGLARRSGINAATGDYITFLDSDDYYAKDCIKTLVEATDNGGIDIISPGFITVSDGVQYRKTPEPVTTTTDLYIYDDSKTLHFLNVQLLRRSLFDNVIYSDRRFIEDSCTFIKLIYYAKSRKAIDYAGYYYVQNPNSLIHSCSKYKNFVYNMLCAKDTCEFYEQVGHPEMYDFKQFLIKWVNMPELSEEDKKDADKYKEQREELIQYITEQFNKKI